MYHKADLPPMADMPEQPTLTGEAAYGHMFEEEIITLDGLREMARQAGRMSGPSRRDAEPYVVLEGLKTDYLTDSEEAVVGNVVTAYNKVIDRNDKSDTPSEIGLGSKIVQEVSEIRAIVGRHTDNPDTAQVQLVVQQLAKFQGSEFAQEYFSGHVLAKVIEKAEVRPEYMAKITEYVTPSRLLAVAANSAVDPAAALEQYARVADDFLSRKPGMVKELANREGSVISEDDLSGVLSDKALLEIAYFDRQNPEEGLATAIRTHDRLRRQWHDIPDTLIWQVSLRDRYNTGRPEARLARADKLNREYMRPGGLDISDEGWWKLLVESDGNKAKLDKHVAAQLMHRAEHRAGLGKKEVFDRLRAIPNMNVRTELAFAIEWGTDLLPDLVSFAEREPQKAVEVSRQLAKVRQASNEMLENLNGSPEEVFLAKALGKSFRQRATELAYVAAEEKDDASVAMVGVIAGVANNVSGMFAGPKDLERVESNSQSATYRSQLLGTAWTLKSGRISFTSRLSDEACTKLRKAGLEIPEKLNGNDRRVGLRIDLEAGHKMSVDIGNYATLRDAPLVGSLLSNAVVHANNVVTALRRTNHRAPERLSRRVSQGHHVVEHLQHPTLPAKYDSVIQQLRERYDQKVAGAAGSTAVQKVPA